MKRHSSLPLILQLIFFPFCFLWGTSLETEQVYLSGTGSDDTVEWEFYVTSGMRSGEWTTIPVPSCWELQGFGNYNYGLDDFVSRENETGFYRYKFKVPDAWKSREVKLVFEGVMTDAEVRVNGQLIGPVHQGAFYEFKYLVTDKLKFGEENVLEVRVEKESANESVNYAERQADFWVFGGIYRPVYLQSFPKNHIDRVAIDAKASGEIAADVFLDAPDASELRLTLFDVDGQQTQLLRSESMRKDDDGKKWTLHANAEKILPWNPEFPHLYLLQFELLGHDGNILHQVSQRIGFRTVEVRESDGVYVNGQRIKFKGVNRHSFYPTTGRTTNRTLSVAHVKMMKDMNMNAVRMSHYPPDVHFLDVCDEYGLFVIDEVCTWHSPHLDTVVGHKIVEETVIRDVNHPSIVLWANGNETGWNTELDDDYAVWDIQKREVIHPWNLFRKTNTLHYLQYHGLANDGPAKDKVFFPTEFLHGLYDGGHGAGLEDYWKLIWESPLLAGGFLWDFADEGVVRTDRDGIIDTDGNHAADGIVGPFGEKEASYNTIKEIWSPIYLEDRFIRDDFNGVFRVENRFHFTDLSDCSMTARWIKLGGPADIAFSKILSESDVMLPDLVPGQKGSFIVEKPEYWKSADVLFLTAKDPGGNEIFTWSYPVQSPRAVNRKLIRTSHGGTPLVERSDGRIQVVVNELELAFSAENGCLEEVKKAGRVIPLAKGPVILGQQDTVESVSVEGLDQKVVITAFFKESDKSPEWTTHKEMSSDRIIWTIHSDERVELYVEFKGKKQVKGYKGISFRFPEEEVDGMKWLGDGPYRVWRNRMKGTRFQVWSLDYNNTVTGESGFEYPEFKGFFSNLYWAEVKGRHGNGFTVYCHSPFIFLRMLTPQNPSQDPNHRVSPVFPEGDISFVKNIPSIGTKFQVPDTMGPQGHSENYFGNDDDPLVVELTFQF